MSSKIRFKNRSIRVTTTKTVTETIMETITETITEETKPSFSTNSFLKWIGAISGILSSFQFFFKFFK